MHHAVVLDGYAGVLNYGAQRYERLNHWTIINRLASTLVSQPLPLHGASRATTIAVIVGTVA